MSETMTAVIKPRPAKGLELAEVAVPRCGPDEVLIEVLAASICGTDRQLYQWTEWAGNRVTRVPFIPGHELCGKVVERGAQVRELQVADFISAESHIVDYGGEYFSRGLGHVAPETQIIGIDRDGAFARYIVLPWQNARRNPPEMTLETAVLKENFGNAVHVGYALEVESKDILITGAGPAGLMTLLVVKARGAGQVLVSDINPYRLDFAARLGADAVINPAEVDCSAQILDLTGGRGVDVLMEMSGASPAILDGLKLVKAGGHALAFGLPKSPVTLELGGTLIFKGLTWQGVVGRRLWDTWDRMDALLEEGRVDLSPIITHQFQLNEFEQAFLAMDEGSCGKVMLKP